MNSTLQRHIQQDWRADYNRRRASQGKSRAETANRSGWRGSVPCRRGEPVCWGNRGQKSIGLNQFEPQNARKIGKCCCILSRGDWDLCCSVNILAVVNAAHVERAAGRKVKKTTISTVPGTNNPWEGEAPAKPPTLGRARLLPSRQPWEGEAPAEPPTLGGRGSCRAGSQCSVFSNRKVPPLERVLPLSRGNQ